MQINPKTHFQSQTVKKIMQQSKFLITLTQIQLFLDVMNVMMQTKFKKDFVIVNIVVL